MVGMVIGTEVTHGHIAVGRRFDPPRAKATGGVAVDQQGHHHSGWILFAAGAPIIDVEVPRRYLLHRIQDEVDDVIGRHPLAQIARQEHRGLAVDIDQTGWHRIPIPITSALFKIVLKFSLP